MPDLAQRARTRRLFFALWPTAALRAAAAERVAAFVAIGRGRPQQPEQLHLTVVFLGAVPEPRLPDVHAVARRTRGEPFVVTLDRLEYWRKPRVLCLCASVVPPVLEALVADLRSALAADGLPTETRPYRPHLTLARHHAPIQVADEVEPLLWPADALTLVQSVVGSGGARYEPLASWPLEGSGDTSGAPRNS